MIDPFEALREPVAPVDPDPRFAARLRARLERALLAPDAPEGATMTTTTETTTRSAVDLPLHTLTPYIMVDDARRALDWYVRALGARRRGEPIVMDDDRIGHAELAIGDSVLMLADEFAEMGLLGPKARGGVSQSLRLEVPDVDGTVRQAVELGAELERPVADYPYGRNGVIIDPFGHRWMVSSPVPTATEPVRLRHGDVAYTSVWVHDVERAAAFYEAVLGWQYAPGSEARGRRVQGLQQDVGLWGGEEAAPTMYLCFAVDDVAAVVERVRAAGGRAEEPTREPYGLIAMCTDNQGLPFAVYELPAEPPAAPADPYRHGDVCYLTIEVPDSAQARSFFGAVLDWEFTRGHAEDGWGAQIAGEEVRYMTGLHGGHERSAVVPMYSVDDIDAAVERVRAAGGTATDPERQPYGITADCVDDQGSHFYLGQLP